MFCDRVERQSYISTGSGKTLIAVLLLRHVIDEELRKRREVPLYKPKISFFLVGTKPSTCCELLRHP